MKIKDFYVKCTKKVYKIYDYFHNNKINRNISISKIVDIEDDLTNFLNASNKYCTCEYVAGNRVVYFATINKFNRIVYQVYKCSKEGKLSVDHFFFDNYWKLFYDIGVNNLLTNLLTNKKQGDYVYVEATLVDREHRAYYKFKENKLFISRITESDKVRTYEDDIKLCRNYLIPCIKHSNPTNVEDSIFSAKENAYGISSIKNTKCRAGLLYINIANNNIVYRNLSYTYLYKKRGKGFD